MPDESDYERIKKMFAKIHNVYIRSEILSKQGLPQNIPTDIAADYFADRGDEDTAARLRELHKLLGK